MEYVRKAIDFDEVREFITKQSPETKIYIGTDSERLNIGGVWYADYMTVIVVHIDGKHGCKVFGEVVRERDFDSKKDRPRMRMLNEAMKTANLYVALEDILDDRLVEIHLDINKDPKHGSNCALSEAAGYIQSICNVVPMVKPNAWCASFAADRFKDIASNRKVA